MSIFFKWTLISNFLCPKFIYCLLLIWLINKEAHMLPCYIYCMLFFNILRTMLEHNWIPLSLSLSLSHTHTHTHTHTHRFYMYVFHFMHWNTFFWEGSVGFTRLSKGPKAQGRSRTPWRRESWRDSNSRLLYYLLTLWDRHLGCRNQMVAAVPPQQPLTAMLMPKTALRTLSAKGRVTAWGLFLAWADRGCLGARDLPGADGVVQALASPGRVAHVLG